MTARDPRIDPRPGDVVDGGKVTYVCDDGIRFSHGPVHCWMTLNAWSSWAADKAVEKRAEDK